MSQQQDFLFELGVEELPPKQVAPLAEHFANGVSEALTKEGFSFASITHFGAPRRLAFLIKALATTQPDQEVEKRGPALNAAYDKEGNPTPAALGFAKSCGTEIEALEKVETPKGTWLFFKAKQKGKPVSVFLPAIIEQALKRLPIPKRMRWGDLDCEFVRPVQWVLALLGDQVLPCEFFNIKASNQTFGHRFLSPQPIILNKPSEYEDVLLTQGHVIPQFDHRREEILKAITQACEPLNGNAIIDKSLLDEVTGLVEQPCVYIGSFDKSLLAAPKESLISAMQGHQKCFPIESNSGELSDHFVIVSNLKTDDPSEILRGNRRVMQARLADAIFFYQQDLKTPLSDRLEPLKSILYQKSLGSLYEKSVRISKLCAYLANILSADEQACARAGLLCKADLSSDMVGEFPELQGIMGKYYAEQQGEPESVCLALQESYLPRHAKDALPSSLIGSIVAISEKVDTMVGIIGVLGVPQGDKDPYALRRCALGTLKIIIDQKLPIDIEGLFDQSISLYGDLISEQTREQVIAFNRDRLRYYYIDQGYRVSIVDAVLVKNIPKPYEVISRIKAVEHFMTLPEAESLAAANKRVSNILSKNTIDIESMPSFDNKLLEHPAESALAQNVTTKEETVAPLLAEGKHTESLIALAELRSYIDSFFEEVLVMADDPKVKQNRLALLCRLRALFLETADISRL